MPAHDTDEPALPLHELLHPGSTLMVGVPVDGSALEYFPLTVAAVEGSRIDILLDTREHWVGALGSRPEVAATLSDERSGTWAWVHATATTTTDAARIDELWSPAAAAFFDDGRDTPGIAVLQLHAHAGRYWKGPGHGRLGSLIAMARAAVGRGEDAGTKGDVAT